MWRKDACALGMIVAVTVFSACSTKSETRAPGPSADGNALLAAVSRDGALPSLEEADHLVRARRPVQAAEILRTGALPAVDRQRDEIAAAHVTTREGKALRRRLLAIYARRAASLKEYAAVLARGEVEDERLASAIHAQATAEREVAEALREVEAFGREGR